MNKTFITGIIPQKIARLDEYIPVENTARIKLDANENPYPMPEPLRLRLAELASALGYNRYPDPYARALTAKFAEIYGVKRERVIAGCGSDEIIHLMCQALYGGGEGMLTAPPDFSMYAFYAYLASGKPLTAPRNTSGALDFSALRDIAARGDCKCVMFSNPCNPTGTVTSRDAVLGFVRSVDCVVVVDEAYGEFCGESFSVLDMAGELPNLVVLKTLSKAFGLAGLRIGFAVANESLVRAVQKVKSPYNLNSFSQAAGVAALERADEVFALAKKISADTKALYTVLSKIVEMIGRGRQNAAPTPPGANFFMLHFNDDTAEKIHAELLRRGISVRLMGGALRISCGTEEENRIFVQNFTEIVKSGAIT